MSEIHPPGVGARRTRPQWDAPMQDTLEVLETLGSERSDLVEFQVHVLSNSTMSFAVDKLAATFDVSLEKLSSTIVRTCYYLDRLEEHRGPMPDPASLVRSPNLAALSLLCKARLHRARRANRRRRLERILGKLERSYELAQARAWIDDFIGPLPAKPEGEQADDR